MTRKHKMGFWEIVGVGKDFAGSIRTFESGATRNSSEGKLDYEGFFHPLVLEAFASYMHKHRKQEDGSLRASDNWQKGVPKDELMKSNFRHFMDLWKEHRGLKTAEGAKEAACGVLFNTMAYLLALLKEDPNYTNGVLL
jgi:hypothetical protein